MSRVPIKMPYSTRTKAIMSAVLNEKDLSIKKIDELALFPTLPFETALCFGDNIESIDQKEGYAKKIKECLLSTNDHFQTILSDVESTFDDSDVDKDYKPSSSSDSDIGSKKKNASQSKRLKIKKMPLSNIVNKDFSSKNSKDCRTPNKQTNSKDVPDVMEYTMIEVDEYLEAKENVPEEPIFISANQKNESLNGNTENVPNKASDVAIEKATITTNTNSRKKSRSKRLTEQEKSDRDKAKHPMRNPCLGKCRKNCQSLTEDQRRIIWDGYWTLEYTSRRKWLTKHVKLVPIKRKYMEARKPRTNSRQFTLPNANQTEISVCRSTFLNTLGYTNDSVITELVQVMKQAPCGSLVKERRGAYSKVVVDRKLIMEHIESFHPCFSHYRRKNAPNTRYLPRELTIKQMYEDFNEKHPNVCKIEIYRQVLRENNISLCQPKSDICEECGSLKLAIETCSNGSDQGILEKLSTHQSKAEKATTQYRNDAEEAEAKANPHKRIYSMDLQKVILLPIMPSSKTCFFTSRLVVFNQTFATLNSNAIENSYCVVWHEALGGRKAEALVDALIKVITKERDVSEFTFWADNCTSQNKNWVLFTSLVTVVNSDSGPNQITIRYLTTGHTHMSADGIHGNIEKKIRRKRNIYDFEELLDVISTSRKHLAVLKLEEFKSWQNKKRTSKKADDPLKGFTLNSLVEVRFERGANVIKYKTDFADDYKVLDFLQKKYSSKFLEPQALQRRGISSIKKQNIIKQLVPLMPLNRQMFWNRLPESETSMDLVNNEQELLEDD